MVLHFNYHRGVGPNIPKNDVLNFAAYDNNGNLIGNGAWITTAVASKQTGFSRELSSYTNDGRIRSVWVDGRMYLFQEDVDRELKVPEGWWSEEAVVKYSGKHPDYLRRLKREGELVGKTVHKVPYYEPSSVKEYFDAPNGTFTREDALDFLETTRKKTLQALVEQEAVNVREKNGRNYYSQSDLRMYVGVPDNYVSIRFMARKSGHSELEIFIYAIENSFDRLEKDGHAYIPMLSEADLGRIHQIKPEDAPTTIDMLIKIAYDEFAPKYNSALEIAVSIAKKFRLPANGHMTSRYGIDLTFEAILVVVEGLNKSANPKP